MTTAGSLAEALYRPPFTLALVVAIVVVVLLAAVIVASRERAHGLLVLRLAGVAGLAWLLLGYSQTQAGRPSRGNPPRLAILIDTSASMNELDAAAAPDQRETTRLDAVRSAWLNTGRLAELRRVADVQLLAFNQQARPADPDTLTADGKATRLIDTLTQTNADATLILSDGHDTTAQRSAAAPHSAGRLFAVPVGSPRSAPDLALQAWAASDQLFENQSTSVTVALSQHGFDGRPAAVELLLNGNVIDRRLVRLDQPAAELSFEVAPPLEPGRTAQAHHLRARVSLADPDLNEAYTDNNVEDLFIQVSRGRVRVLLIEGEPYWDTRSLARLVGAHPRFDLTAVFGFGDQRRSRILGEAVRPGTDPTMDLSVFDIVVLGRRVERLVDLGFAKRLTEHAQSGGAVVFARGRPFGSSSESGRELLREIEPISPVSWGASVVGEMRVRLGESADPRGPLADLQDQAVLSRLPGMLAATRIEGRKAASLVLLEQQSANDEQPIAALATLRVGSGVTMAVLAEGLWRWELMPGGEAIDQTDSVYGVFWVRALQWLASGGEFLPGQDIALEADRLGIEPGQSTTLTVSTRYIETQGLDLELTATNAQGQSQPLALTPGNTPGRYTASFSPDTPGVYRITLAAPGRADLIDPRNPPTTSLAVVERSSELRDTSARPDLLKALTESTGGRCLALDESEPPIEYLQSLQSLRQPQIGADYDFNTWPAFAWIAGFFGLEWVLRRRMGLR